MLKTWLNSLLHEDRQQERHEASFRVVKDECRVLVEKGICQILSEMDRAHKKAFLGTKVRFPIPGLNEEASIMLEVHTGTDRCTLTADVLNKNNDHRASKCMLSGTHQEIRVFLKDPKNMDDWMNVMETLSRHVKKDSY